MASPAFRRPDEMPLDVLFPEAYEASRREITRDFVAFGFAIVASVLLGAAVNLAMRGV